MTALVNALIAIQAPKGVIPDLSNKREDLVLLADFFNRCAMGMEPGGPNDTQIDMLKGASDVGLGQAYALVTLATCAALTGVKINGVKFTALASGTANTTYNQFTISGTDAADATALAAAINASASAGVSGVVQACNLATTIALGTVLTGQYVTIDGIRLTAFTGAPDRNDVFSMSGASDTLDCTALVACINAHPYLSRKFLAVDGGSGTLTLRQKTGTTGLSISASAATFTLGASAPAAVSTLLITSRLRGAVGNSLVVEAIGIQASTTATCVSVVATDTLIVNGQTLTAIVQRATGTLTAATAIAGTTCVVNGVTFTGMAGATGVGFPNHFSIDTGNTETATDLAAQINAHPDLDGVVTATSSTDTVTIRAVDAGTAGNSLTLVGTVTVLAASAATLEGGIAVANNQFDCSPGSTDTQVAADIVRCIGASTTTLISSYVRATNLAGVVTVYSLIDGPRGNGITLSSTGGTITCAAARLAGATIATTEGVQASCTLTLASVLNAQTVTINGVVYTAHTNTQANDQFSIAGTDDEDAAALCEAINNSTTAGSLDIVATVATNVVTVKARRGGIAGNLITVAASAATVTISGSQTRLINGAAPVTVTGGIQALAGGVGGNPATVYSFP